MTTLEMFIEAAKALQKDPVYLRLDTIRNENEADEALVNSVNKFNAARAELTAMMSGGEPDDKAKIADLNNSVRNLYTEIMENKGMVAYNEAKEELDVLLTHVQAVINAAVSGEDPATAEPPVDCAGSCSSCSGCGS